MHNYYKRSNESLSSVKLREILDLLSDVSTSTKKFFLDVGTPIMIQLVTTVKYTRLCAGSNVVIQEHSSVNGGFE